MSKPLPPGVPEGAQEVTIEQLQAMAQQDPSLQPLVAKAIAVRIIISGDTLYHFTPMNPSH
jgi:hypothetical protein